MDSDPPAEEVLVRDIRRSLTQFVQQNLEYTSLLHFITECQHAMDSPDTPSDEQIRLFPKDTSYPAQVNNTLYTQLRMHSTCSCSTQHLENARLRLNPEHNTHDDENIPFELLFVAGTTSHHTTNCQYRWREAKISVARYRRSKNSRNG